MAAKGNPREIREVQQRFDYEIRNKGVRAATDRVFADNAALRASERKAADRKMRDHLEDNVSKELERRRRDARHFG